MKNLLITLIIILCASVAALSYAHSFTTLNKGNETTANSKTNMTKTDNDKTSNETKATVKGSCSEQNYCTFSREKK